MKPLIRIQQWTIAHGRAVGILRIALGLLLVIKGITFLFHLDMLTGFLRETGFDDTIGLSALMNLLAQLIIILHLIGGICIAFGVRTRFFCLLNLPILIGAALFVNLHENSFRPDPEFLLSMLALFTIVFFLITEDHTKD
jgi:putative oxidoreductase